MRLKKLMAVACAAALTVTAFAGCSKKNDSSSGSDSKGDAKKEYYNAQPVDTGWEWGNVEIVDGVLSLTSSITLLRRGLSTPEQIWAALISIIRILSAGSV